MENLSKEIIQKLMPKDKPYKVFDTGGLYVEISPKGLKTWRMKFQHEKKEYRYSLGHFPQVSLVKAREERDKVKGLVEKGKNPAFKEKKSDMPTFERVAAAWLENQKQAVTEQSYKAIEAKLKKYVFPCIGRMPVNEVSKRDIVKLIEKIKSLSTTAKKIVDLCRNIFGYAYIKDYIESNPCELILKQAIPNVRTIHRKALTTEKDALELVRKIEGYNGQNKYVRLCMLWCLYTLSRPSEAANARWDEIKYEKYGATWTIPIEKMKMRRLHRVPLNKRCEDILKELKSLGGGEGYLFRGDGKNGNVGSNSINCALKFLGYEDRLCAHGFRSMGSTILNNREPQNEAVIEAALAHVKGGVAGIYDRGDKFEKRRALSDRWGKFLDSALERPKHPQQHSLF